jgi:asparagine synthase (glutamine-hydrolysing)
MCGIAGILNLNGAPVSEGVLERMCDVMAHRGPDDKGVFVSGPVGLGHRRLSIIDLSSAGHQPMFNEDGQIALVFNGEIYNYRELRTILEAAGHVFSSHTDTEVVIHAYEEWGENCVTRFNGMFAFGLWDSRRHSLFLARDRYGIKPLYYYEDTETFTFASEIKAILAANVKKSLCLGALDEYFTFQNIYSDRTLFEGIRTLGAGTWATINPLTSILH